MDIVVDQCEPKTARRFLIDGKPAVNKNRGVMKIVEKNELLFARYNEKCIEQFGEFARTKQSNPCSCNAFTYNINT
jgi:hypothetical protein